jgi:hypothetical protein
MSNVKTKRIRAQIGDVFTIPISSDERVYGQVVDQAEVEFLVVVFHSNSVSVEEAVTSEACMQQSTLESLPGSVSMR